MMKVCLGILTFLFTLPIYTQIFIRESVNEINYMGEPIRVCIVNTSKNEYYLGLQSGDVYTLKNDSIIRLDNTPDHRLNINSYIFSNNDTIFKYGGYGYWSNRNFLTFFDVKSKEWEYYKTTNEGNIEGSSGGEFVQNDGQILFLGGVRVDQENRLKSCPNTQIIKFDSKKRKLSNIGELTFDTSEKEFFSKIEDRIILFDVDKLYELFPFQNIINIYNKPKYLNAFRSTNYTEDGLLSIVKVNNITKLNDTLTIKARDLFLDKIGTLEIYRSNNYFQYITPLVIVIILGFILVIFLRYDKRKFKILSEGIKYQGNFYALSEEELIIFRKMIEEEVNYNDLFKLVENKNLTYSHNTRLFNQLIDQLNTKTEIIFKLKKTAIVKSKSIIDRRLTVLEISKELLDKIKLPY